MEAIDGALVDVMDPRYTSLPEEEPK